MTQAGRNRGLASIATDRARRAGRAGLIAFAGLAGLTSLAACRDRGAATASGGAAGATAAPEPPPHEAELVRLRAFENDRRAATDFAALPPSEQVLGPDPYRLAALGDGTLVGILRGESAVVALGEDGAEQRRIEAPRSPSGLAVSAEGDVLVVGDAARDIAQYRWTRGRLARVGTITVDALGLRDVALSSDGRTAYAVEERDGRLLAISLVRGKDWALRASGVRELGRCHGPFQIAVVPGAVAVNCVLDHAIEIRPDGHGDGDVVRIHHDGPIWSFALRRERDGGLLVAAGGIEDHPLEREDGGFGYIDSYVYLYRLGPGATQPVRLAAINSSELGAVTPKWLAFDASGAPDGAGAAALSLTTAGYASASLVTLTWRGGDLSAAPEVTRADFVPGTTSALRAGAALIAADPLLDAWILERGGALRTVPVASARPARPVPSRIGELLFFTTMLSPWNSAEGKLSRFTCETCHHEGYVDGRTHFTGRGTVHATTRPLYGLFNNRPHFSRALDKTMADMVHAEFRVANRHNGRDPWFALTRADVPWLDHIPGILAAPGALGTLAELPPELLRRSFMAFLMDFSHRANPAALDHARFTERERRGADVFRAHCATCHEARLVADQPGSVVPFERWEALVLSPSGPIVWSNAAYAKTGVLPLVHADGARVPPLRRLYKKWPYFTNGSARSLDELLDRFATAAGATYHDGAPDDATQLTADDKAALRAFLDLL